MKQSKALVRLDALYAELPTIECRGLCVDACGPIAMSALEHRRLGPVTADPRTLTCSLLIDGRCSRYRVRPLICRLYGLTKRLTCPFGCIPSRYLSDAEAREFLARAEQLSEETW